MQLALCNDRLGTCKRVTDGGLRMKKTAVVWLSMLPASLLQDFTEVYGKDSFDIVVDCLPGGSLHQYHFSTCMLHSNMP